MVPNEVKVNGVKIDGLEAAETSQPVHVNIHIHQESALPELLNAGKSLLKFFVKPAGTLELSARKSRLQLATWTAQIILGATSGALGVFFYIGSFYQLRYSGAAFWTGAVAISAGVVAIIQEKWRGTWWSFLKNLFILATISTSIAAIAICAQELQHSFYYIESVCDKESFWPTRAYNTPEPQEAWKKSQCLDYMNMLRSLSKGITIMALLVWITLLVVTLVPTGFTLVYLCFCCQSNVLPEEDVDEKKPLHGELNVASPAMVAGSCEA
ncbi:transmembrane protein 176A-like [Phascolarctos cinereus]|uniref:Transmembrane protein 176A-like n=1 Tax=Phascolarctos cinereus TaxID=38626 RepID=A0A6P5JQS1_PHACI|nr:transmembrane protein 176A-like [Phascolarctos cinereus]